MGDRLAVEDDADAVFLQLRQASRQYGPVPRITQPVDVQVELHRRRPGPAVVSVLQQLVDHDPDNGVRKAVGQLGADVKGHVRAEHVFHPDVLSMAVLYLRVYLIGMPVILLYNFESAIFQSQGDTRTPLYALIASGIVNVFLNLFFVLVVHMTVDGVATATVISNVISSAVLFVCLCRGRLPVTISRSRFHINGSIIREMVRIGLPAGIQGMVFSVSNIIIQSGINSLGTDVVAGSSASANLEIIGFYLVDSFAQACTTFVGQNYGAGDLKRCRESLKWSLLESIVIGGSVSMLLVAVGRPLMHIFNPDPSVIDYGMMRLEGILPFEILNGAIDVISGAMRGYGESMKPAIVTLVGVCGVRITWIYTYFQSHQRFDVLLRAYPMSWIVTLAIMSVMYVVMRKNGLGQQRA